MYPPFPGKLPPLPTRPVSMFASSRRTSKEHSAELGEKRIQNRVFVGGLNETIDENDLRGLFSQFGEVKEVQLKDRGGKDENDARRGHGFVTFKTREQAQRAIREGRGEVLEIKGVRLNVCHAVRRLTRDFPPPIPPPIAPSPSPYPHYPRHLLAPVARHPPLPIPPLPLSTGLAAHWPPVPPPLPADLYMAAWLQSISPLYYPHLHASHSNNRSGSLDSQSDISPNSTPERQRRDRRRLRADYGGREPVSAPPSVPGVYSVRSPPSRMPDQYIELPDEEENFDEPNELYYRNFAESRHAFDYGQPLISPMKTLRFADDSGDTTNRSRRIKEIPPLEAYLRNQKAIKTLQQIGSSSGGLFDEGL